MIVFTLVKSSDVSFIFSISCFEQVSYETSQNLLQPLCEQQVINWQQLL